MTREEAEKVMHTAKYALEGLLSHYGLGGKPETVTQAAWTYARSLHEIKERNTDES